MMNVDTVYTWDEVKAESNLQDHGISFETAIETFGDPHQIVQENDLMDGEQRYELIGMTQSLALLFVVFVVRENKGREVIRLISARKAVKYEQNVYADQFR